MLASHCSFLVLLDRFIFPNSVLFSGQTASDTYTIHSFTYSLTKTSLLCLAVKRVYLVVGTCNSIWTVNTYFFFSKFITNYLACLVLASKDKLAYYISCFEVK